MRPLPVFGAVVAVGGMGVAVGGTTVAVGGTGVAVGGTAVGGACVGAGTVVGAGVAPDPQAAIKTAAAPNVNSVIVRDRVMIVILLLQESA